MRVTVEYVSALFGAPVFRTALPEVAGKPADATELIFRTRHAWLQVLVRNAGAAVEAFSITVTDPRFKYRTRHLTFEQIDLRLGTSRFAVVRGPVDGWSSRRGARRFGYAESHWFGNPGCYQAFILSYNDAGTGHFEPPEEPGPTVEHSGGRLRGEREYQPEAFIEIPDWLRPARAMTTVNTITVLGSRTPCYLAAITGVNGDQVRVLRESRSARKQRRWLRQHQRVLAGARPAPPDEAQEIRETQAQG
jgi:hypothetical protein